MLSNVYLGIMLIPNKINRVKIEKINLEGNVKQLTEHASKLTNRPAEELELVYGGITLQDDCTLSSYDVKSGKTIFVMERMLPLAPKSPPTPRDISEVDFQMFLCEFEKIEHMHLLKDFSKPEVMDELIKRVPLLLEDPAAIALLQDQELFRLFVQPIELRKILDAHPVLIDTLTPIANYLRDNSMEISSELSAKTNSANNSTSAEESDASGVSSVTRTIDNNNATGNVQNELVNYIPEPDVAPCNRTATLPSNEETHSEEESIEHLRAKFESQLQQMNEIGLSDETENIRLLQLTLGNINAAVNLALTHIEN